MCTLLPMDHKWGYAKGGNSYKKNMIAMEIFISLTYISGVAN